MGTNSIAQPGIEWASRTRVIRVIPQHQIDLGVRRVGEHECLEICMQLGGRGYVCGGDAEKRALVIAVACNHWDVRDFVLQDKVLWWGLQEDAVDTSYEICSVSYAGDVYRICHPRSHARTRPWYAKKFYDIISQAIEVE